MGASLEAQLVKDPPAVQEIPGRLLGREDLREEGQAAHCSILGFPGGSDSEEPTCKAGGLGSISGLGRSPGEGDGYPLQCSVWRTPWTEKSDRL